MKKIRHLFQFISFKNIHVWVFIAIGLVLIIIGETKYVTTCIPWADENIQWINNSIKLIGTAIISGGVVSSITQSSSFLELYRTQFEKVIWSKDFLKNRHDIHQVWSVVSNILYKEKFHELSDEIHETISRSFFPIDHEFYIDNLHINMLITCESEVVQIKETWDFGIVPSKNPTSEKMIYNASVMVYLYPDEQDGESSIEYNRVIINENLEELKTDVNYFETKSNDKLKKELKISLPSNMVNKVTYQSEKSLLKSRNNFSRMKARYFYNNLHVHITTPVDMRVELHEAGTVKNFTKVSEYDNNNHNQIVWKYDGIILPHQGYYLIFK